MAEIKVEPKIVPLTSAMQEAIHKLNEVGDSFEVIGSALGRMMDGGCGQPGHTTRISDEGTSYCLTCELEGQNKKLRAERDELLKSLKLAENLFYGLGGRREMGIIRESIAKAEKGGK